MTLRIKTNNVPHDILNWYDLTPKEQKEFDYIQEEDRDGSQFVRYRKWVYDLHDVERINDYAQHEPLFKKWHGIISDSFFSGVVFRYVEDFERVVCGTYLS
jgi:hypothetical protein